MIVSLLSWFAGDVARPGHPTHEAHASDTVPLVCVRHYQHAVSRRSVGERVYLVREIGNPYDAEAIVVVGLDRSSLGLIARDCGLLRPLLKEGQGCSARIEAITRGASGTLGVIIRVELGGQPIGVRAFRGS